MIRAYATGLKGCRERAGLSRQQVADALGILWSSYDRWERCIKRCPDAVVAELAKILGVDEDDITGSTNRRFDFY